MGISSASNDDNDKNNAAGGIYSIPNTNCPFTQFPGLKMRLHKRWQISSAFDAIITDLRVVEVNDKNNPRLIGLVPNLVLKGVVKYDHLENIEEDDAYHFGDHEDDDLMSAVDTAQWAVSSAHSRKDINSLVMKILKLSYTF